LGGGERIVPVGGLHRAHDVIIGVRIEKQRIKTIDGDEMGQKGTKELLGKGGG